MRWPLGLYRVAGRSMEPTYRDEDILLGRRFGTPKIGDVVVVQREIMLIKRLTKIEKGKYWIEGDNADHSTDSRSFGWIDRSEGMAIILFRIGRG